MAINEVKNLTFNDHTNIWNIIIAPLFKQWGRSTKFVDRPHYIQFRTDERYIRDLLQWGVVYSIYTLWSSTFTLYMLTGNLLRYEIKISMSDGHSTSGTIKRLA